jgi:hypothetical protein
VGPVAAGDEDALWRDGGGPWQSIFHGDGGALLGAVALEPDGTIDLFGYDILHGDGSGGFTKINWPMPTNHPTPVAAALDVDAGAIWVAAQDALVYCPVPLLNCSSAITKDTYLKDVAVADGWAWVVGDHGVLMRTRDPGQDPEEIIVGPRYDVQDLWLDSDGGAWAAQASAFFGGVLQRTAAGWARERVDSMSSAINAIARGADGKLYAAGETDVWRRLDDASYELIELHDRTDAGEVGPKHDFPSQWRSMSPHWIVGQQGYIAWHNPATPGTPWLVQHVSDKGILDVVETPNGAWAGGTDVLLRYDGSTWSPVDLGNLHVDIAALAATCGEDVFFSGTPHGETSALLGYYSLATHTAQLLPSGLSNVGLPLGLALTPDGHVWGGTASGSLMRYPDLTEMARVGSVPLTGIQRVQRLRYGNGALWLGTTGGGILRKPLP